MARYCFYCNRELAPGEKCSCQGQNPCTSSGTESQDFKINFKKKDNCAESIFQKKSSSQKKSSEASSTSKEDDPKYCKPYLFGRQLAQMCTQLIQEFKRMAQDPEWALTWIDRCPHFLPPLVWFVQALLVTLWIFLFAHGTRLGYAWFSNLNIPSAALTSSLYLGLAFALLTLLASFVHCALSYLLLRLLSPNKISWKLCVRQTLPGITLQILFLFLSSAFLYGSGFFSLLLALLSYVPLLIYDYLIFLKKNRLSRKQALYGNLLLQIMLLALLSLIFEFFMVPIGSLRFQGGFFF